VQQQHEVYTARFPEVKPAAVEAEPKPATREKPAVASKRSPIKAGQMNKGHMPKPPKTSLVASFARLLERVDVATQRAENAAASSHHNARSALHVSHR